MNIQAESHGHTVVLNVKGELTADTLDAFRKAVEHQLEEQSVHDIVVNCQAVPFIDSAALECLLDLQQQLAERLGQVKLAQVDENVAKVLEMTRLESAFEQCADAAAAVKGA